MARSSVQKKPSAQEGAERGRLKPDIFHAADTNDVEEMLDALAEGQRLDDRKTELLGMTPAHLACIKSSSDFMLAACAQPSLDPWIRDDNGRVPFDHAAARGNKPVLSALFNLMYPPGSLDAPKVVEFPAPRP